MVMTAKIINLFSLFNPFAEEVKKFKKRFHNILQI